ncbi:MAG: VanZ family protein [Pseudomonadota bacterium]
MSDSQKRRAPRGVLARILAIAYWVVIAYTSLQPFRGWWLPPEEIRAFLSAPWPRYITLEDVLINICAYVPLGFLLTRAFMARFEAVYAVLLAAAVAMLTSVSMECIQMFMPTRIASNVDILTNSLGGLIGALASPLFAPSRILGIRLTRLRAQWFVYGISADVGLILVFIWLISQTHPNAQLFGTGNLRDTFALPIWLIHTPQLLVAAEAAVAGFNLLGVGLLVVALTRETMPRGLAVAAVMAAGLASKALVAYFLSRGAAPFAWLTPGVIVGLLVGSVVLYGLTRVPRRVQWVAAGLSLAAALVTINIAPENPYQTIPHQFLRGATHFLSLSELWPFLALIYTVKVAWERPDV